MLKYLFPVSEGGMGYGYFVLLSSTFVICFSSNLSYWYWTTHHSWSRIIAALTSQGSPTPFNTDLVQERRFKNKLHDEHSHEKVSEDVTKLIFVIPIICLWGKGDGNLSKCFTINPWTYIPATSNIATEMWATLSNFILYIIRFTNIE